MRRAASHCQQHEGHGFHVAIATRSIQNCEVALCHDNTQDSRDFMLIELSIVFRRG